MENYIQPGRRITVSAPYALLSGEGCLKGAIFGVAVFDAAINTDVELETEGVVAIKKTSALAISVGDQLYWDNSAKEVNKTSSGTPVGVATKAAANPSATVEMKLEPNFTAALASSLTGAHVEDAAEDAVIGAVPTVYMIAIAAGALGDKDTIVTHKIRVIDAYLILRGGGVATTTLQVKNGANAITDAMAASGADQALVRAATIDDANYVINAGGTLRVTSATGATQPNALVVVTAVRVA